MATAKQKRSSGGRGGGRGVSGGGGGRGAEGGSSAAVARGGTTGRKRWDVHPLLKAAQDGDKKLVAEMLKDGVETERVDSDTIHDVLMAAAETGQLELLIFILGHGGSVWRADQDGNTALLKAAAFDRMDCMEELLRRGATANATNRHGETCVSRLAMKGNVAGLELLLRFGASVTNAGGGNAVHIAASMGHVRYLKTLLEHGADADYRDSEGRTPIMRAAMSNQKATLDLLLDHGCDVEAKDNEGSTALVHAHQRQHKAVIKRLSAQVEALQRKEAKAGAAAGKGDAGLMRATSAMQNISLRDNSSPARHPPQQAPRPAPAPTPAPAPSYDMHVYEDPYSRRWKEEETSSEVLQLVEMGFDPEWCTYALKDTGGDVNTALSWLMNQGGLATVAGTFAKSTYAQPPPKPKEPEAPPPPPQATHRHTSSAPDLHKRSSPEMATPSPPKEMMHEVLNKVINDKDKGNARMSFADALAEDKPPPISVQAVEHNKQHMATHKHKWSPRRGWRKIDIEEDEDDADQSSFTSANYGDICGGGASDYRPRSASDTHAHTHTPHTYARTHTPYSPRQPQPQFTNDTAAFPPLAPAPASKAPAVKRTASDGPSGDAHTHTRVQTHAHAHTPSPPARTPQTPTGRDQAQRRDPISELRNAIAMAYADAWSSADRDRFQTAHGILESMLESDNTQGFRDADEFMQNNSGVDLKRPDGARVLADKFCQHVGLLSEDTDTHAHTHSRIDTPAPPSAHAQPHTHVRTGSLQQAATYTQPLPSYPYGNSRNAYGTQATPNYPQQAPSTGFYAPSQFPAYTHNPAPSPTPTAYPPFTPTHAHQHTHGGFPYGSSTTGSTYTQSGGYPYGAIVDGRGMAATTTSGATTTRTHNGTQAHGLNPNAQPFQRHGSM